MLQPVRENCNNSITYYKTVTIITIKELGVFNTLENSYQMLHFSPCILTT